MIATAPGKLFLLGEYAVLEGAPAIVTSVAQCASVEVVPGHGSVCMKSGDITSAPVATVSIIQAAARVISASGVSLPDLNSLDFCLDTSAFFRGNEKLGLGSSAALTVALVRALAPMFSHEDTLELAMACHREFQGGTGSGADIAAALVGGCIVFRRGRFPAALSLPRAIQVSFIWTGRGSGTVPYLDKLSAWRLDNPDTYDLLLQRLTSLAEAGINACQASNADLFIETVAAYDAALLRLSESSGTGFYTDTHQSLATIARQTGCTYKPSGAGGGDFGVAFANNTDQIRAFQAQSQKLGYDPTIASMNPAPTPQE